MDKYLKGYVKSTTRNRKSKIDSFEPIIKKLLSKDSIQIFYYKRIFIKCHDLLQQLKRANLENRLDARLKHFSKFVY